MTEDSELSESPTKYLKWRIKNFFDLPTKDNYELKSSQFCLFDSKWFFKIYPNGSVENNSSGFIDIFLFREAPPLPECVVSLKMGIINANGSEKFKSSYNKASFSMENCGSGFSNVIRRSTLKRLKNTLVPNGTLTVFCYVRLIDPEFLKMNGLLLRVLKFVKQDTVRCLAIQDVVSRLTMHSTLDAVSPSTLEAPSPSSSSDSKQTLIDNLEDVYISRRCTDITIVVKGKEIPAHKVILAARSDVFATMFDHDMMVKNNRRIEVPDCDPDSFEKFLLYLYTGKFDLVSSSNTASLYEISEKYNVQELKEECQRCMTNEINRHILT